MFQGSIPALVTPFRDGALDLGALEALVEWQIGEGSHGIVPVGTTGESPTLSHAEHDRDDHPIPISVEVHHAWPSNGPARRGRSGAGGGGAGRACGRFHG